MKSIAIIPARGGSVRIPGKNTVLIHDKPLVAWAIECAIKSGIFNTIAVSTNDDDVKHICKAYPQVTVVHRPAELARGVGVLEQTCMGDVMNYCGPHGHIFLLQPTSPLRTATSVIKANDMLSSGFDSVVGVVSAPESYFAWTIGKDGEGKALYDQRPRTQDIRLYQETGVLYATTGKQWEQTHLRVSGRVGMLELPKWEATDINDLDDLELARWRMSKQQFRRKPPVP